jgi:Flp pilus assembly pilin Flp
MTMFLNTLRSLANRLWQDDNGAVTLEYLLLGTLVAAGSVAGLSAMTESVNNEMKEFGSSVRQIRQAYTPQLPSRRPATAPVTRFGTSAANPGETVPGWSDGTCDLGCP